MSSKVSRQSRRARQDFVFWEPNAMNSLHLQMTAHTVLVVVESTAKLYIKSRALVLQLVGVSGKSSSGCNSCVQGAT
jgi:hypothetical protein